MPTLLLEEQLVTRLRQAYCRDLIETNERICRFVKRLRAAYPYCERYRFYHLLVGSTPTADCSDCDLPAREIERFVEALVGGAEFEPV